MALVKTHGGLVRVGSDGLVKTGCCCTTPCATIMGNPSAYKLLLRLSDGTYGAGCGSTCQDKLESVPFELTWDATYSRWRYRNLTFSGACSNARRIDIGFSGSCGGEDGNQLIVSPAARDVDSESSSTYADDFLQWGQAPFNGLMCALYRGTNISLGADVTLGAWHGGSRATSLYDGGLRTCECTAVSGGSNGPIYEVAVVKV